jgi:hypothetical protein
MEQLFSLQHLKKRIIKNSKANAEFSRSLSLEHETGPKYASKDSSSGSERCADAPFSRCEWIVEKILDDLDDL